MRSANRLVLGVAMAGLLVPGIAWSRQATDQVSVQLRDGTVVRGALEDLEGGTLYVRVSLHDQRRIPIGDVALIDRVVEPEGNEARGGGPVVVLTDGTRIEGTLVDIHGGAGSGDPGQPRTLIVRIRNGAQRRVAADRVSRVYLGHSATTEAGTTDLPTPAGTILVRATDSWVDTGVIVSEGQSVMFATTGQVQLSSDPADTAQSPGRDRTAAGAPLPQIRAGALIGRIGPNGQPFAIGNQASVPMPSTGRLYLMVNDDERSDNSGAFDVVITPSQTKQ